MHMLFIIFALSFLFSPAIASTKYDFTNCDSLSHELDDKLHHLSRYMTEGKPPKKKHDGRRSLQEAINDYTEEENRLAEVASWWANIYTAKCK